MWSFSRWGRWAGRCSLMCRSGRCLASSSRTWRKRRSQWVHWGSSWEVRPAGSQGLVVELLDEGTAWEVGQGPLGKHEEGLLAALYCSKGWIACSHSAWTLPRAWRTSTACTPTLPLSNPPHWYRVRPICWFGSWRRERRSAPSSGRMRYR